MIPRVRLKYVQGLAGVHEDLHLPREVDLTTDGAHLIVSSAASGRPLLKVPFDAVESMEIERNAGPTKAENLVTAAMTGRESVIAVRLRAARGVPAVALAEPIVFAPTRDENMRTRLEGVQDLLVPRTAQEMASLERGERRFYFMYTAGFILVVALVLALLVGLFLVFGTPQRNTRAASVDLVASVAHVVAV